MTRRFEQKQGIPSVRPSAKAERAGGTAPSTHRDGWLIAFVATLLPSLLWIYSPALDGPLAFDDYVLAEIANQESMSWRPEARPLVAILFSVETSLFGDQPRVHRLVNIAVHVVAATLLFLIVKRLAARFPLTRKLSGPLAWLVAMLWAVHPLQTESVAYIVQRAESLMGLFYFAYLLCFIFDQEVVESASPVRDSESGLRAWLWNRRWLLVAIGCFMAGLWSKTIMVTALAVAPLMDRAFLSSDGWSLLRRRAWVTLLPMAAGALAIFSLLPGLMRGDANVGFGGDAPPWPLYLAGQVEVWWSYLGLVLVPNSMSIDHGLRAPATVLQQLPWFLLSALWIVVGVLTAARKHYKIAFFLLAPLLVLSPTSSFIPTADLMVEHRMYVPLAIILSAAAIAVVRFVDWSSKRADRKAGHSKNSYDKAFLSSIKLIGLASLGLVVLFGVRTWLRAADYESAYRLWSQAVRLNPDNDRAIQNAIDAAEREGLQELLCGLLIDAIAICETHNVSPVVPLQRLGELYVKLGQPQSAMSALKQAIELDELQRQQPGFRDVHRYRDRAAMHVNFALALLAEGQQTEAYQQILLAFEHFDYSPEARAMAGQLAAQMGDSRAAEVHFRQALLLRPQWPEVERELKALQPNAGS